MMTPGTRAIFRVVAVATLLAGAPFSGSAQASDNDAVSDDSVAATWVGTAQVNGREVPFRLEVSGAGDEVHAAFINGREKSVASSGNYSSGHLVLHFDYYANSLDATLHGGTLTGTFGGRAHTVPITAQRNGKPPAPEANPPRIAGVWNVAVDSGSKGEHSWKLRVLQNGPNVDAVIERIDGDTGNLYGVWRDGAFTVSHFTAAGPGIAVLRPQPDGSLQLETAAHGGGVQAYNARRASGVHAAALETLDDPLHHTSLKNPNEPLAFRFPDLNGKLISNTDLEFAHKALIVSIGGSWCPNCQDEAPFLEALYRKYHGRGLEIVELSFEEASQLQNPVRLRAVIHRYGITYPVLVAGTPDQLDEEFPHVANLDCWPTTFFVGKDGLVKAIHTGYAGPATGGDNRDLEKDTTALVERLLAGRDSSEKSKTMQVARAR
jgi:thiol-disulfide isomerase/thioredoxin